MENETLENSNSIEEDIEKKISWKKRINLRNEKNQNKDDKIKEVSSTVQSIRLILRSYHGVQYIYQSFYMTHTLSYRKFSSEMEIGCHICFHFRTEMRLELIHLYYTVYIIDRIELLPSGLNKIDLDLSNKIMSLI